MGIKISQYCLLLILTICSCRANTNHNFEKSGIWYLEECGSETVSFNGSVYFDYINYDDRSTLVFIEQNVLSFYNLNLKQVYRRDTIKGHDNARFDALAVVEEKIVLTSRWPFMLYVYNLNSNELKMYNMKRDTSKARVPPAPNLRRSHNVFMKDDNLYLGGTCIGEGEYTPGDRPQGICLNTKNCKYHYFMDFPKIYYKYNWGGLNYRHSFTTSNNLGTIVFSFPACHDIYLYNTINGNVESRSAGSSLLKKIEPFSYDKTIPMKRIKEESNYYYFTSPSYGAIAYDKYRNVYYRMVEFPNLDYGRKGILYKPKSIVILDDEFNFKGEVSLSNDKIYANNIVVTEEGIVVPTINFETRKKGYSTFKLVKDE